MWLSSNREPENQYQFLELTTDHVSGQASEWSFWILTYRPRDEGTRSVRKNMSAKYVSVQAKQTRLIRLLLYGFWFIFISVFSAVFVFRWPLQMTWFVFRWPLQMTRFVFRWPGFASRLHSRQPFICLAYRPTAFKKNNTTMFQDTLLFEFSHKNIPNPFIFYLN